MDKSIKRIKKYIPLIVILSYILIMHFVIRPVTDDDIYFSSWVGKDIFGLLKLRYLKWSSRSIIEIFLIYIMSYAKILWSILDGLIILLLYYSINRIVNIKSNKNTIFLSFICAILIILYPFGQMSSSGWGATTMNYLWPLSLGIFAMIPIVEECFQNKKCTKLMRLATIPALIYACNQEQMCLIIIGFLLVFNIQYYITNKRINKSALLYLIIALISITYILTCPGNGIRFKNETKIWFHDFNELSIIQKCILSINNTFQLLIGKTNYLLITMYSFMAYVLYKNKKNRKLLILTVCLLLGCVVIPHINIFNTYDLYIIHLKTHSPMLQYLQLGSKKYILSIVISIIYLISTIYILYNMYKKDNLNKYMLPLLFLAGILSRFIVGFSPTLFASKQRTAIFMYFSIVVINMLLLKNLKLSIREKKYCIFFMLAIFILAKIITISFNIKFII